MSLTLKPFDKRTEAYQNYIQPFAVFRHLVSVFFNLNEANILLKENMVFEDYEKIRSSGETYVILSMVFSEFMKGKYEELVSVENLTKTENINGSNVIVEYVKNLLRKKNKTNMTFDIISFDRINFENTIQNIYLFYSQIKRGEIFQFLIDNDIDLRDIGTLNNLSEVENYNSKEGDEVIRYRFEIDMLSWYYYCSIVDIAKNYSVDLTSHK